METLNPFSKEGHTAILDALAKGITFNRYDGDTIIESLKKTIPQLKGPVGQAIEKVRKQEQAKELEEELAIQAAVKMNTDKSRIQSRVHVVR